LKLHAAAAAEDASLFSVTFSPMLLTQEKKKLGRSLY
jgi:hypothetical protein